MAYQVLARKFRPQTFADVIGQEHITRTLQNAIQRQRVGHAYLFVGPRGIGKTTTARIFAKALNCEQPKTDAEGRSEPCCQCSTCQEIAAGNCLDVIEIDGASNNSVANIRDLRDIVQYTPTNGRKYKIFIIDEVHMLSTSAWNALLKTLEEPPPHVKFLFATTEAHKVLATVVSRCQRFDLKRLSVPHIVGRLEQIARQEGIHITPDALTGIARAADGAMRDGQSIFDQIISFCGGQEANAPITESDVIEVFGLLSRAELKNLAEALLHDQPQNLIGAVHGLAEAGRDLERLYADLVLYLRSLMVFQIAKEPERMLELSDSEAAELKAQAALASSEVVQRLVEGLLAREYGLQRALNKRVALEAILLRVMREAHALTIDDLVRQMRTLQEGGKLSSVAKLPPVSGPPATLAAGPLFKPPAKAVRDEPAPPATTAPDSAAAPAPLPPPTPPAVPLPPPPAAEAAPVAPVSPVTEAPVPAAPAPVPTPTVAAPPPPAAPAPAPIPTVAAPPALAPTPTAAAAPVAPLESEAEPAENHIATPALATTTADEVAMTAESAQPALAMILPDGVLDDPPAEEPAAAAEGVPAAPLAVPPPAPLAASSLVTTPQAQAEAARWWTELRAQWGALAGNDPLVAEALAEALPLTLKPELLIVGLSHDLDPSYLEALTRYEVREELRSILARLTGRAALQLRVEPIIPDWQPVKEPAVTRPPLGTNALWRSLEQHELVQRLAALFDGRLVDVRPAPG